VEGERRKSGAHDSRGSAETGHAREAVEATLGLFAESRRSLSRPLADPETEEGGRLGEGRLRGGSADELWAHALTGRVLKGGGVR
jgi:hypothetical protein